MKQHTRSCDPALLGPRGCDTMYGGVTTLVHCGCPRAFARNNVTLQPGVTVRIPAAAWLGDGAVRDFGTYGPGTMCRLEKRPMCAPTNMTNRLPWPRLGPKSSYTCIVTSELPADCSPPRRERAVGKRLNAVPQMRSRGLLQSSRVLATEGSARRARGGLGVWDGEVLPPAPWPVPSLPPRGLSMVLITQATDRAQG